MIEDLVLFPLRYAALKNCINMFLIRDLRFSIMRHLFNSLQALKNFQQKTKANKKSNINMLWDCSGVAIRRM